MGATDSKLAFRKGVFRLFEERVRRALAYSFLLFMPLAFFLYIYIECTKDCR
jgi:hypothetical protein